MLLSEILKQQDYKRILDSNSQYILENATNDQFNAVKGLAVGKLIFMPFQKNSGLNFDNDQDVLVYEAALHVMNSNNHIAIKGISNFIIEHFLGIPVNDIKNEFRLMNNKFDFYKYCFREHNLKTGKNSLYKPNLIKKIMNLENKSSSNIGLLLSDAKSASQVMDFFQGKKSSGISQNSFDSLKEDLINSYINLGLASYKSSLFDEGYPNVLFIRKEKLKDSLAKKVAYFIFKNPDLLLYDFQETRNEKPLVRDSYGFALVTSEIINQGNEELYLKSKVNDFMNFLHNSKETNLDFDPKKDNFYLNKKRPMIGVQGYVFPSRKLGLSLSMPELVSKLRNLELSVHGHCAFSFFSGNSGFNDVNGNHIRAQNDYKIDTFKEANILARKNKNLFNEIISKSTEYLSLNKLYSFKRPKKLVYG